MLVAPSWTRTTGAVPHRAMPASVHACRNRLRASARSTPGTSRAPHAAGSVPSVRPAPRRRPPVPLASPVHAVSLGAASSLSALSHPASSHVSTSAATAIIGRAGASCALPLSCGHIAVSPGKPPSRGGLPAVYLSDTLRELNNDLDDLVSAGRHDTMPGRALGSTGNRGGAWTPVRAIRARPACRTSEGGISSRRPSRWSSSTTRWDRSAHCGSRPAWRSAGSSGRRRCAKREEQVERSREARRQRTGERAGEGLSEI